MSKTLRFKDWGIESSREWSDFLIHRYNRFEGIHDLEERFMEYTWNPNTFVIIQSLGVQNIRPMRLAAAFFTYKYFQHIRESSRSNSNNNGNDWNMPPRPIPTEIWQLDSKTDIRVDGDEITYGLTEVTNRVLVRPLEDESQCYTQTSIVRMIQTPNYEGRLYDQTKVRMSRMNPLDIACQLKLKYPNRTIAYVNIADRKKHGGQWKAGNFGQEEYLYARSAMALATKDIAYELDHWACLYTKGLRVVRLGEEKGYRFIQPDQQPAIDVVTVAGDGGADADAGARGYFEHHNARLRVKLEAVLSMCAERGVNSVVFGSTFPGFDSRFLTAALKAVFEQFAGIFQCIYVGSSLDSIYEKDKYMYSQLMGPNMELFPERCEYLDDFESKPGAVYLAPPLPWSAELTGTNLLKPVCKNGGMCRAVDPEHYERYEHPPFCPCAEYCYAQKMTTDAAKHHLFLYYHKKDCPDAGTCRLAVSRDEVERTAHNSRFNHPKPPNHKGAVCKGAECLFNYLHDVPSGNEEAFKVNGKVLPSINAHNKLDLNSKAFCYKTPYCKLCLNAVGDTVAGNESLFSKNELRHIGGHMHICDKGKMCRWINDPWHAKLFVHTSLSCKDPACPYGGYHIDLLRSECPDPRCTKTDPEHLREFAHHLPKSAVAPIPILKCADCMGGMPDYRANTEEQLKDAAELDPTVFDDVKRWVEGRFRPTLACSKKTLDAYIALGFIPGRGEAHKLWPDYKKIARIADESVKRSRGSSTLEIHDTNTDDERKKRLNYISHVVRMVQNEVCEKYREKDDLLSVDFYTCIERRDERCNIVSGSSFDSFLSISHSSSDLDAYLDDEYKIAAKRAVEALEHLVFNGPCAVLGPHPCDLDDCTELLVLREDVMHHPDFFVCHRIQSGVSARQGLTKDRLHPMDSKWVDVIARNLIRSTAKALGSDKVSLKTIIECWGRESTEFLLEKGILLEAHLPSRVPLECVEKAFYLGEAPKGINAGNAEKSVDLYASALKYIPHHYKMMDGLCFMLSAAGKREVCCPAKIPDGESEIKFRVRGGDFYFSLFSECDAAKPVFSFYVDGTAHSVLEYVNKVPVHSFLSGFNDGCNTEEFVEYSVSIREKDAKEYVYIGHWGCSRVFNSTRLKREIPKGTKLKYISFFSDATKSIPNNHNATVVGLTIENKNEK